MNKVDLEILAFGAFRYGLGRKTYYVGDITQILKKYANLLEPRFMKLIVKEINEAIKNNNAGMDIDVVEWVKVKECLLSHLREKTKVVYGNFHKPIDKEVA